MPDWEAAGVAQVAAAEALTDPALDCMAPPELPVLEPAPGVWPGVDDVLSVVCVALPRAPPPPPFGALPPFSTVELAWMIAWRKG
ncbi:hypothetical protein EAS64_34555 [Trebonia kvetii]|uniref:Uncharacterized protein n=1 Tax=Trebonia kvetii TaxID=2480626 RepID=A0A6P2BQT8_9ACTN|nr:hypothetical protein [Trebonia kvetii]TVZ01384.1 hypothetical protein EAS64_34555 [Trebonia kvetii]